MNESKLNPGDLAPGFTLMSDAEAPLHLSEFRGKKVLLYFYPKAGTPGCTQQACALRDLHPEVTEKGVVVIGISPDTPQALRRFRQKYDLPFVLLSDPEREVARLYGTGGSGLSTDGCSAVSSVRMWPWMRRGGLWSTTSR